jgi:hypothetical protein
VQFPLPIQFLCFVRRGRERGRDGGGGDVLLNDAVNCQDYTAVVVDGVLQWWKDTDRTRIEIEIEPVPMPLFPPY